MDIGLVGLWKLVIKMADKVSLESLFTLLWKCSSQDHPFTINTGLDDDRYCVGRLEYKPEIEKIVLTTIRMIRDKCKTDKIEKGEFILNIEKTIVGIFIEKYYSEKNQYEGLEIKFGLLK